MSDRRRQIRDALDLFLVRPLTADREVLEEQAQALVTDVVDQVDEHRRRRRGLNGAPDVDVVTAEIAAAAPPPLPARTAPAPERAIVRVTAPAANMGVRRR